MKTKNREKEKSAVEQLRDVRDKISLDIQDMTFEQIKLYIEKKLTLHPKSVWGKHVL